MIDQCASGDDVSGGATFSSCYIDEDSYGSHVGGIQERIEPISRFGPMRILPYHLRGGKKPDFIFLTNK